jgi:WD40 repeat protein
MDRTKQDPLSHTKEPNQTEQITLEDLERKLAASSINSETLTVDPAQFLSINLVDKDQKETASHKLETNKNQESTASPSELPIVNYDCDTEDLSLFFAPPDATATTTESDLDSYGIDIDIEPLPIAFSRSNRYEETNSLLDPSEYQHIFDEEYLAAFIQEIQDQEEPLQHPGNASDLVQAFDHLDIDQNNNPQQSIQQDPQDLPVQGLGQSIYCLPCTPGAEDFTFGSGFVGNIDSDLLALEQLRQEAELDFDQDGTFGQEDLQTLLKHVMQEEARDIIGDGNQVALNDVPLSERAAHDDQDQEPSQVQYQVSDRREALDRAEPLINAFYKHGERQCFGHKDKIFGIAMSPCGNFFATASQDSTICIWDVELNRLLSHLEGSKDHECLRVAWASDAWARDLNGNEKGENGEHFKRSDDDLILAMAGADGVARIWQSVDGAKSWRQIGALDHMISKKEIESASKRPKSITEEDDDEKEKSEDSEAGLEGKPGGTEIYSLQFIDEWSGLPSFLPKELDTVKEASHPSLNVIMTSSEDFIHIWQHCPLNESSDSEACKISVNATKPSSKLNLVKIMDIKFTHLEHGYGGVFVHLNSKEGSNEQADWSQGQSSNIVTTKKAFGGDRNPDNLVYVFDAVQCPANNLIGAALSDGTLRLVNSRGICVTILQLPGCQSHLTSFAWDKSGYRLASCVATGHVILWDVDYGDGKGAVQPVCRAVLEGGHNRGRPLFGASFFGGTNEVR